MQVKNYNEIKNKFNYKLNNNRAMFKIFTTIITIIYQLKVNNNMIKKNIINNKMAITILIF